MALEAAQLSLLPVEEPGEGLEYHAATSSDAREVLSSLVT